MATQSNTLAWKIQWMEEPGRLQSMGSRWVGHDWVIHFHFSLSCIGEGNGNPLLNSCLENPRDGGAWWAAIYGVVRVGHDWSDLPAAAAASQLSYYGQESLRRNGVAIMVNKRVQNAVLGCNLKIDRMISVLFQGKPFNIMVIQAYAPTSNAEEGSMKTCKTF